VNTCRCLRIVACAAIATVSLHFAQAANGAQPVAPPSGAVPLEPEYAALYYYKATNEQFDFAGAAKRSQQVNAARGFDKPQVQKAEEDRLHKAFDAVSGDQEFSANISVTISEYDFSAGEFSIDLFEPGHYIPLSAFGKDYQLVFENADELRAIKMPVEEARQFDSRLRFRTVTAQVRFKLTGAGDKTGVVASTNTIRSAISNVRLLGENRTLLRELTANVTTAPAPVAKKVPTDYDVQGLHLGMTSDDFMQLAKKTFETPGPLLLNENGCGFPGASAIKKPHPGTVCLAYEADKAGIVRRFSIRQVLEKDAPKKVVLRKLLLDKYGPVAFADGSSSAWGELVGNKKAENYTVFATMYPAIDDADWNLGTSGFPVLWIAITDPDYAKAKAVPKAAPAAAAPKL
jgi:hypothetical protein